MASPRRTHIVVDRVNHVVKVYQRAILKTSWRKVRQYRCAVGALGYKTPAGMTEVDRVDINPIWYPPDSAWVGESLRDPITKKPIPIPGGDPRNPLKGAFVSLSIKQAGIGIHGTANIDSLGTDASHGCIRLSEEDVLDLVPLAPVGTPCYII